MAIVVATGLIRATTELGGWSGFARALGSGYGRVLLAKAALAAALIALGGINRYRALPRIRSDGGRLLRTVVPGEVLTGVAILALTGALTSLAPPSGPGAPARRVALVAQGTNFATTVRVRLTVSPGLPGSNDVVVGLQDPDTGRPIPAEGVTLRFECVGRPDLAPRTLELEARGGGRFTGTGTQLAIPGVWQVTARLQLGSEAEEIPLWLAVPNPEARLSRSPGALPITTVAFPSGEQVQVYLDPAVAGRSTYHLTAFDAVGGELALRSAELVALPPEGPPTRVPLRLLSPGHGVGELELSSGPWTLSFLVETRSGGSLVASYRQVIPASEASPAAGPPGFARVDLGEGRTVQVLVARATGAAEIHLRFYREGGGALEVGSLSLSVSRGGTSAGIPLERIETGHFLGSSDLPSGRATFHLAGEAAGEPFEVSFPLEIP